MESTTTSANSVPTTNTSTNPSQRCILVVGEGDFGFARSYCELHPRKRSKLVCTELTSYERLCGEGGHQKAKENILKLKKWGVLVACGIDIRTLQDSLRRYEPLSENTRIPTKGYKRIVCNFPFSGNRTGTRQVVDKLFEEAQKLLRPGGEVWLSTEDRDFNAGLYDHQRRSRHHRFRLVRRTIFDRDDAYHQRGYQRQQSLGTDASVDLKAKYHYESLTHVFVKIEPNDENFDSDDEFFHSSGLEIDEKALISNERISKRNRNTGSSELSFRLGKNIKKSMTYAQKRFEDLLVLWDRYCRQKNDRPYIKPTKENASWWSCASQEWSRWRDAEHNERDPVKSTMQDRVDEAITQMTDDALHLISKFDDDAYDKLDSNYQYLARPLKLIQYRARAFSIDNNWRQYLFDRVIKRVCFLIPAKHLQKLLNTGAYYWRPDALPSWVQQEMTLLAGKGCLNQYAQDNIHCLRKNFSFSKRQPSTAFASRPKKRRKVHSKSSQQYSINRSDSSSKEEDGKGKAPA